LERQPGLGRLGLGEIPGKRKLAGNQTEANKELVHKHYELIESEKPKSNKAIYTIFPSLFSRPDDWGENLKVLGFHKRS
jgi:hypothetical protein